MKQFILFLFLVSTTLTFAQYPPTSTKQLKEALRQKERMAASSLVKNIPFQNIGPSIMSGRVVDLDVNPSNSVEFYVAYASGGLWYTNNNGTSFTPVMDTSQTQNIGDIAIDWKNGTLWVGTGENNASRSSYAGVGILKSTDKGKTWQHMGLADSHHIGRIVINPNNPNEVVVGAMGHLYSPNEERGIYKTTDGGKTWKKTLFINSTTGIIDVAYAPQNFNLMYASAWQKDRKAWNFTGSGNGSGIYKSTDGGSSWTKISTPESGFPTGEGVGRIGLAVFDTKTLYVVLDNQFRRKKTGEPEKNRDVLQKEDLKTMSTEDFLGLEDKKLNTFLKANNFQEKYKAANVKQMVRSGDVKPIDLVKYMEDANAMLFDTPVIGAEVYRSEDAGKTWRKMNADYIENLYYSYGYYFGEIRVAPNDSNKIYLGGVLLIRSDDGGKTYTSISRENVHADHHALWIDPNMPGHLVNGNDGGVNISFDDGQHWIKNNAPAVGQFYDIDIDHQKPYKVYGGLQDNGVWVGPHNAKQSDLWQQTGQYPWKSIMGGDGMQVQIDHRDPNIVYAGFQFGNYFRIDVASGQQKYIQPKHELGEAPYRFNWQTPILLSPHNQDILYLGSNKLHRSLNQGEDWETISDDLTQGGKKGNVAYGTLTTISESPFKFGLLYTGSDDGLVQVTKDGGGNWERISNSFPKDLWVSRVVASMHKKERVYVTLNGYRWDDFTPYIYKSEDYGKTWESIANTIPAAPVNVITEDPENENLLYTGTDNGVYVSFNQGASWELFSDGLPSVAVHDLVVQPEAKDLLVGTHGRSIYKAHIATLQEMDKETLAQNLHVFKVDAIKYSDKWGNSGSAWSKPNTPGINFTFYTATAGSYTAKIRTDSGIEVSSVRVDADKGFNILSYDVAFSKKGKSNFLKKNKMALTVAKDGKTYLPKGNYEVEISGNGATQRVAFEIKAP